VFSEKKEVRRVAIETDFKLSSSKKLETTYSTESCSNRSSALLFSYRRL